MSGSKLWLGFVAVEGAAGRQRSCGFSSLDGGVSPRLAFYAQRRRHESSLLVEWRDLVADLLTDVEAVVFVLKARRGASQGSEE